MTVSKIAPLNTSTPNTQTVLTATATASDADRDPITFTYVDDQGQTVTVDGSVALADAFFNPTMFRQTGVNGILKYAASTHAEVASARRRPAAAARSAHSIES